MPSSSDSAAVPVRARIIVIIASMLALPALIPAPLLSATTISGFTEGAAPLEVTLQAPMFEALVHIPVPNPSIPLSGALDVTTVPGAAPVRPRIDLGGDGSTDWEFNATYGPFGNQSLFADGMPNLTLQVSGISDVLAKTNLPKGARAAWASLNMTCHPKAPQMAQNGVRNNIIPPASTLFGNITGIPRNATGINASVRIDGGKKTVMDQRQEDASDMRIIGNMTARQSLAQTFSTPVDAELIEVQYFINNVTDTPGTLSAEIRAVDANGTPNDTRLSTTMTAPQNSVYAGTWNFASFNGLALRAGQSYAFVVYARNAMTNRDSYYGFGCNLTDGYKGGALWAYPDSLNASGRPQEILGADMAFRAVTRVAASPSEMGLVKVNGAPLSLPDADGAYWTNFSDPVYDNGNWPVAIDNPNIFNLTHLNWSATTWYERHIENITLDTGNDGTVEAWEEGQLEGTYTMVLPPAAVDAALENAQGSEPDRYGVSVGAVDIAIFATGYGWFEADSLSIGYELSLPLPDFKSLVAGYMAGKPEGVADFPVLINASSAGSLALSSLAAVVDTPPSLISSVPSLSLPEDGSDMRLLDLREHIRDDFDPVLMYAVLSNSNSSFVLFGFNGTFLTARTTVANWSGTTDVVLEATDSRGQKARTNEFTVWVDQVNDPPVIVSAPPARAELGRNFTYQVRAVDAENGTLSFGLDVSPSGMAVDPSGLVTWVPARDQLNRSFEVAINVSDGKAWSVQRFNMTVGSNNRRPVLQPPVPVNETAWTGKPYFCQFRALDLDSDGLSFSLDAGPQGMAINASSGLIDWPGPTAGDFNVTVNVTDGIDFDRFGYMLRSRANSPPVFSSKPVKKAVVGENYVYDLKASDFENGSLSFSLVQKPEGMVLQPGGQLTWTPAVAQKGKQHVVVAVSDGVDTTTQPFDIAVTEPPAVDGGGDRTVMLVVAAGAAAAAIAVAAGWMLGRKKPR